MTAQPQADPAASVKRDMRGAYDLAAPRYERLIAPTFVPIARRVVSLARPLNDDIHLDLATGTGLVPAMTDDRRTIGCIAPWRVAMDLSANMLRAARLASPPTRLVQGDLERLPFGTGAIDLITLALALHHLPTPRRALAELRRILSPRGRLVLAAWGDELSPLWREFDRWYGAQGLGPSRAAPPNDLPIDTPERLAAALGEVGGFGAAEVVRERPPIHFASLAEFWEWRISFPAPNQMFAPMPPDRRARLRDACLAELAPQVTLTADGLIDASQAVLFAVARP
ncbi:MAG: class I SAM-dependent methyltransferase [Chloroflexi bacterium]|nr:class I SAM-dependent methyltransferase [Chloroflexota bacterium]